MCVVGGCNTVELLNMCDILESLVCSVVGGSCNSSVVKTLQQTLNCCTCTLQSNFVLSYTQNTYFVHTHIHTYIHTHRTTEIL